MPEGIIICGANGSGKTTLGRELARILNYKCMDIEDYYFEKSDIPYTKMRSREECVRQLLSDICKYNFFVLSSVDGDYGGEIAEMYKLAVFLSAPVEVRMTRIEQRAYEQFGERVMPGGDMYEQQQRFMDFAHKRSLTHIDTWMKALKCPVIQLDGTKAIYENVSIVLAFINNNIEKKN